MSTVVLLSAADSCFSNVMVEVGYTPWYRFLWHLLTSRLRRSVNKYHHRYLKIVIVDWPWDYGGCLKEDLALCIYDFISVMYPLLPH